MELFQLLVTPTNYTKLISALHELYCMLHTRWNNISIITVHHSLYKINQKLYIPVCIVCALWSK